MIVFLIFFFFYIMYDKERMETWAAATQQNYAQGM